MLCIPNRLNDTIGSHQLLFVLVYMINVNSLCAESQKNKTFQIAEDSLIQKVSIYNAWIQFMTKCKLYPGEVCQQHVLAEMIWWVDVWPAREDKAYSSCRVLLELDYPAGNRNCNSRTYLDNACHMAEVFWVKSNSMPKQIWAINILWKTFSRQRKIYARILPDEKTLCARIFTP